MKSPFYMVIFAWAVRIFKSNSKPSGEEIYTKNTQALGQRNFEEKSSFATRSKIAEGSRTKSVFEYEYSLLLRENSL